MSDYCFSFLENEFPDIAKECFYCEKFLIEGNFSDSVRHAGTVCELITKSVSEFIGKPEWNELSQYKRLIKLFKQYGIIPFVYETNFHKIKNIRNNVLHNGYEPYENETYRIHSRLFKICVWFYNTYGKGDNVSSNYDGPIYVPDKIDRLKVDEQIEGVVRGVSKTHEEIEKLKSEIEKMKGQTHVNVVENPDVNDNLINYPFECKHGSFLLNELSKLNLSSSEAVENEDKLTNFKKYIHVKRSIQDEFIEELEKVVNKPSSHLVMLCGNVGDGKSHLLSYLKTNLPDLYEKFNINGDATQSYYTTKNEIETLYDDLSSFNDENIENSTEKFILAINLGVLNNFLESEQCSTNYTKLKKIIDEANIFDSNIISKNITIKNVSFITFTDYNLFELNNNSDSNYVSSDYIKSLLGKITNQDKLNNPFYRAYLKDKNSGYVHPIIYNYEMLCDEEVQDVLIEYIIRVFIEYKKIISTRDLLNTIYELLVPPKIIQYSKDDSIEDFVEYLLPNMLFNNAGRSNLLKLLSNYDPTINRSEILDNFIIKFNISNNLNKILDEYFDYSKLKILKEYLNEYSDLNDCSSSGKHKLIILLIRLAVFYGKNFFKDNFVDDIYIEYLKFLYYYNIQEHNEYEDLLYDIKSAIFKLKGSFKKDYICIDELNDFKVSKEIKIKFRPDMFEFNEKRLSNRFKTSIMAYFYIYKRDNLIPLEINYPLYSAICKLNKGYKPNKIEKENLILFEELINNLINETQTDDLYINSVDDENIYFTFEYDEHYGYNFEKGG